MGSSFEKYQKRRLISSYFSVVVSIALVLFLLGILGVLLINAKFISDELEPKIEEMHFALIRLIDQIRMLDQDMIRLQQKVNVVLEYKATQKILEETSY